MRSHSPKSLSVNLYSPLPPQLEFYLTNGETSDRLQEDRPSSGSLYTLPTPSSFKLSFGGIRPFMRGGDERVMLVSDLDGEGMRYGIMCGTFYSLAERANQLWLTS